VGTVPKILKWRIRLVMYAGISLFWHYLPPMNQYVLPGVRFLQLRQCFQRSPPLPKTILSGEPPGFFGCEKGGD